MMFRIALALAALFGIFASLAACASQPPQQVTVVVTATPTHTPVVIVVTATPSPPESKAPSPEPPTSPAPASPTPTHSPTQPPAPSPTRTPDPSPTPMPTLAPVPTQQATSPDSQAVSWSFPPTIDGTYLHFSGTTSRPGLLEEFVLGNNPYCSQFHLYRGGGQQLWLASVAEPLQAGWYYEEVPGVAVVNGRIDADTGQFSITARLNEADLAGTQDMFLTIQSRALLGDDGFCLPSETYSRTPISVGRIPENHKSTEHYHLDAIQWQTPPTVIGDAMQLAGKASPGVVRLTWEEGYCSQFQLYEHDEFGYHYIGPINPLLPSGRFWNDSVIAEFTSQRTDADGTFEATVRLDNNALNKYVNPVLLVGSRSVFDENTARCNGSEALSAIDIRRSTLLPSPTPTPAPTLPPTPMPTATPPPPSPTPTPETPRDTPASTHVPFSQYDTQNIRWLRSSYPALYRQIQQLPWVEDGLFDTERDTLDELLYIGARSIPNLKAVLELPWTQGKVSTLEHEAIYWLRALNYEDTLTVGELATAPFLRSLEPADVLAIRGMHSLAYEGLLSVVMDHPTIAAGITDTHTALVSATATLNHPREIIRMMDPNYADIETESTGTEMSPYLKISIIRTGNQPHPSTMEAVRSAVEFVEKTMQLPLPVEHVILVLNDHAVTGGFSGTNHGHAFGYRPGYEEGETPYDRHTFFAGMVHEVAHYFWRGNEDWIDEGLANTVEYMNGVQTNLSPGLLQPRRQECEVHDLEALVELNPGKDHPQFVCNYYLGQLLFQELLESMGEAESSKKLREFYRLSLMEQGADNTPGIAQVLKIFSQQAEVVEKHWSGKLNAPENRPFNEGVHRANHGLIEWVQYPTYDGDSITFSGALLGNAVLSNETLNEAEKGGTYQNFTISQADEFEHIGTIFPPLDDNSYWHLDDPGDTNALNYQLQEGSFTIKFRPRQALRNLSDYVVIVWGFQDDSRTPFIGEDIDILGYARIRVP